MSGSAEMKNIQVIEGAENCTFDIYAVPREVFEHIFPGRDQDVEFEEDLSARLSSRDKVLVYGQLYKVPLDRKCISGIHGTLFLQLHDRAKYFPGKSLASVVSSFTMERSNSPESPGDLS